MSSSAIAAGSSKPAKKKNAFQRFYKNNTGFFFIIPWLIGFLVFKLYPFGSSLVYSFSNEQLFHEATEWGFMNYEKIFTDAKIVKAFQVTFKYAFMTVPLKLVAALFIAYILNFKLKAVNFFRTAYYIPSILGGSVAIAVLWKAIFKDDGLLNSALALIGISGPNWLSDPDKALFVICLLRVWQFGSAMVIFLAALKGVPEDLYEAASLDGAGKWRQFFSVTVPLISPVIFYNLVTQLCQAFQEFNGPYIITKGGPRSSTTLASLLIYNSAFGTKKTGLSYAMAWIMFLIIMFFTVIATLSQKYWVYYSDDDGR